MPFSKRKFEILSLWGLAFVLLALRLYRMDLASFIHDEPKLQLLALQAWQEGRLPLLGLVGSQPIPYGPVPTWLYMICHALFSSPMAPFYFHAFFCIVAILLLVVSVRIFSSGITAAWIAVCLASSPFLFFYARLPWDNTFLFFESSLVVLGIVLVGRDFKAGWGLIAVGAALATGTHLMCLPLIVSLVVPIFYRWRKDRGWILLAVAVFLLLVAPYVYGLLQYPQLGQTHGGVKWGGSFRGLVKLTVVNSFQYFSSLGFSYFIRQDIASVLGIWLKFDLAGTLLKLVVALSFVFFFYKNRLYKKLLPLFVVVAWGVHVLYMLIANVPPNPHYNHSIWFIGFLLLAFVLQTSQKRTQLVVKALIGLAVVSNLYFLFNFYAYVERNQETLSEHIGLSIGLQLEKMQRFCDGDPNVQFEVADQEKKMLWQAIGVCTPIK